MTSNLDLASEATLGDALTLTRSKTNSISFGTLLLFFGLCLIKDQVQELALAREATAVIPDGMKKNVSTYID